MQSAIKNKTRLFWLDLARSLAIILVLWDHLVGGASDTSGKNWPPNSVVNVLVFQPLGITQWGGFLGVSLFFLISGYIITLTSQTETHYTFAIRRILRIFPPLALAVLVSVVFAKLELWGNTATFTFADILLNMSLINYLVIPQVILVGVAWSLLVEVTYYILTFFFLPIIKSKKYSPYFPLMIIFISGVMIWASRQIHSDNFFLFSTSFLYLPLLAIGASIAILEERNFSKWILFTSISFAWVVFLYGTYNYYPQFLNPNNSYPISAIYSVFIFIVLWLLRLKLTQNRVITFIAKSSYSTYLFHGVISVPLMMWLLQFTNFTIALIITLITTFGVVIFSYKCVEIPFQKLSRRITNKSLNEKSIL